MADTAPQPVMPMVSAVMWQPLAGSVPGVTVLHAVDSDGLPYREWETAEWATAACGARVKLWPVVWPVPVRYARGLGVTRCVDCLAVHPQRADSRARRFWTMFDEAAAAATHGGANEP